MGTLVHEAFTTDIRQMQWQSIICLHTAVAVLGRVQGGLSPLTFCPGPPQFFHGLLIIAPPHSALGGLAPRPHSVLARTATGILSLAL